MAALAANVAVVFDPASNALKRQFKTGAISDEFYRGALLTYAVGTGLAVCTSADASEFLGVCDERKSLTGTATNLWTYFQGIFWFACTALTDANYGKAVAAGGSTDNPADIALLGAGTTGQIGTLVHVDVTATSGWIDISMGARGALGSNT